MNRTISNNTMMMNTMMNTMMMIVLMMMTTTFSICNAFQVPMTTIHVSSSSSSSSSRYSATVSVVSPVFKLFISNPTSTTTSLAAASDDDDDNDDDQTSSSSQKRRSKRKRKSTTTTIDDQSVREVKQPLPPQPKVELKPRNDAPVQLEIKNVSELVAGSGGGTAPKPKTTATVSTGSTAVPSSSSTNNDDTVSSTQQQQQQQQQQQLGSSRTDLSLEQLLEDARRMKEEESSGSGVGGMLSDEDGTTIKDAIRNVLSTIVTADFFVVCGFLVWFLAGIFCRAAFHDDTVQIAFNSTCLSACGLEWGVMNSLLFVILCFTHLQHNVLFMSSSPPPCVLFTFSFSHR
jgi:hypothetical protein